uniref:Uncharacterized protein n=1 Tax=Zea mays TaxID=4577 RepID=A0A804QEG5_MAIZE
MNVRSRRRRHGFVLLLLLRGLVVVGGGGLGDLGVELIVADEPVDEVAEAGLEGGGRAVAEVVRGVADVGVGERHVAVAGHGDDALVGLPAQQLLEDGHHPGDGHGGGVAEVVDAERRWPAFSAGPGAGALAGGVERAEAALDDVVDVGEVAARVGAVGGAEQRDGLAGHDAAGEEEVGHVGAAPRPVHGEEAEAGDGEPVDVVVGVRDGLAGLLGGRVQRRRAVGAVVLGEGRVGVEPVHGRGRGPDDRRLRVGVLGRHLQDADEPGHVGRHVRLRRLHGVPHPGLRGQVQHVRERRHVEEPLQQRGVVDVGVEHQDAAAGQQRLARALQRRVVVGVEVVEAQDAVAAGPQRERAVRAHEARGAGDQHGDAPVPARPGAPPHLLLPRGAPVRRRGHEQAAVRGGGARAVVGAAAAAGGEVEGAREEGRVVQREEEDERERGQHGGAEEQVRRRGHELGAGRPAQQQRAPAGVPLQLHPLGGRVHRGDPRRRHCGCLGLCSSSSSRSGPRGRAGARRTETARLEASRLAEEGVRRASVWI